MWMNESERMRRVSCSQNNCCVRKESPSVLTMTTSPSSCQSLLREKYMAESHTTVLDTRWKLSNCSSSTPSGNRQKGSVVSS